MRKIQFRAWADDVGMLPNIQNHIGNGDWAFGYMLKNDKFKIMQFTGLTDKNGVDIYEGDIIKSVATKNDHHQRGATNITVVKYFMSNACLCFTGCESGVPIYPLNVTELLEVIGNIHENPELLGG